MFQIIYASTAAKQFAESELYEMLARFREKNGRVGITGFLLYKHGSFLQVLEGDEATVRALYDKICADQQHRDVDTLLTVTVKKRQFPDWSMGFKHLEIADAACTDGYKTPRELSPSDDVLPWKASVALRLLATLNAPD